MAYVNVYDNGGGIRKVPVLDNARNIIGTTTDGGGTGANLAAELAATVGVMPVPSRSRFTVQVSAGELYIRTPWDSTQDQVQKIAISQSRAQFANNPVEFVGARKIPSSTLAENTASTWAGSGASNTIAAQGDEAPPIKVNGQWTGGNHGPAIGKLCVVSGGHGKTAADIGSLWDGPYTPDYIIARIVDANNLLLWGAVSSGSLNSAANWGHEVTTLTSVAFTHIAGAANAATFTVASSSTAAVAPILHKRTVEIAADGVNISPSTDAVYSCSKFTIGEQYSICNPPALWSWLRSQVGNLANDWTPPDTIDSDIEVTNLFRFAVNGSVTNTARYGFQKNVTLNYLGGAQALAPYYSGMTLSAYVPGVSPVTVGANTYDLKALAPIATIPADVPVNAASWLNASYPPDLMAEVVFNGATAQFAQVIGHSPIRGASSRSVRATKTDASGLISSARKMYPYGETGYAFPSAIVPAGTVENITAFRHIHNIVGVTDATVASWFWDGNDIIVCMDFHKTSGRTVANLPAEVEGWNVSIIYQESVDLLANIVSNGVVAVVCSAAYGRIRLRVWSADGYLY